jgi:nucleotide-binding universal stress UspA family protein
MSVRIILTPLFGDASDARALKAGLGIAHRLKAHLAALFVRIDPSDAIPLVGEGVSPAIIEQLTQAAEAEMNRQHAAARATFEAACTPAATAIADSPPGPGGASAGWREVTGRRDELVPSWARLSDLAVFNRPEEESAADLRPVLEATLFGAGRPLLLVPPAPPETIGNRVAIAWNGRAEAARALAGALPFLDTASSVHVLTAETRWTDPQAPGDLIDYLAWRGVACERQPVAGKDEPVGEALLAAAGEAGANLLVMGGYGRSRLSELVLGGVTRHVLSHANLPVLIAH